MAFGHESLPTRKYAYGIRLAPHGEPNRNRFPGFDLVLEQMRKALQFQNRLVELERARRTAVDNEIARLVPAVATLLATALAEQQTLQNLRTQLVAANVVNRKKASDPAIVAQIEAQRVVCAAAWSALSTARSAAFKLPNVKVALRAIDTASTADKAAARVQAVNNGLYWGTSLQVATRVSTKGYLPHFKQWDDEETISVQFQRKPDKKSPKVPVLDSKGQPRIHGRSGKPMMSHAEGSSLITSDIFTPNPICWFELVKVRPPLLGAGRTDRAICHFRVGSTPKGKPIWADIPIIWHREMPPGEVKWAHVTMRRVGTHIRMTLCLDVSRPEWPEHPAGEDRATEGTVAVALGWRQIDGAVRTAEWVGTDDAIGSVLVPADLVRQWRFLEELQSRRDKNFDIWHEVVLNFVRSVPNLSQEWQNQTATLAQWNSPRRLAHFMFWWRDNRLPGDDDAFRAAMGELVVGNGPDQKNHYTGGCKQDKHLCDWQAFMRKRLLGWRKDFYRKLAIDMSYQYKNVVVAEIDWAEIAENPEPENDRDRVNKTNRAVSSCASLRDELTHYLDEQVVSAVNITVTCHSCGRPVAHPGRGRWISCERCGITVDRAENAARNLLQRALSAASAPVT